MKTILVTTDLSDESKVAFPQVVQLAKAFSAKIILLAVIEDPTQAAFAYAMDFPVYPDPDIHKQVVEKVRSDVKELAQTNFAGLQYEFHVVEAGSVVHSEILTFARNMNVDLIIIASHGRTGLSRLLIGSVAERLVRECHCPILVVPSKK